MDGTLLNTMKYWRNPVKLYAELKSISAPFLSDELLDIAGDMPTYKGIAYLREHSSDPLVHSITPENVLEVLEHYYFHAPECCNGVPELLEHLKQNGVKMCCASATPTKLVDMALEKAGIRQYFDFIITTDEYPRGKASPEIFIGAAERFGCKATDMALFEDAYYSMKTAKELGIYIVAVEEKYAAPKRAEIKSIADVYVKTLRDFKY